MPELKDLVVDDAVLDQNALAAGLHGIVGVGKDGSVRPLDGWEKLSEGAKVLCGLLALKAAKVLGYRELEGMKPTELANHLGLARGTVQRVLPELAGDRLAAKDGKGAYFVPNAAIRRALASLRSIRRETRG